MPKRILLADDSITIQKVVELTFSDGDYEVTAVNNGAKAIQKLSEMRPDIVLSDIIMPEKNGYEVCEYIKSHPDFRNLPVILLTGTFEPFDPDRADKAGCDAVVTKPFESQSLIQKVEELIEQSRAAAPTAPAPAMPEPSQPFATGVFPPGNAQQASGSSFPPHGSEIFSAPAVQTPPPAPMSFAPPPPAAPAFGGETRAFPPLAFGEPVQNAAPVNAPPPPPPPAMESSPWDEPAEEKSPAAMGSGSASMPSSFDAPPTREPSPWDEPVSGGETRAFGKMTYDDLKKMSNEGSSAFSPPPPPPAAPEPSPWDAPDGGGATRAIPRMNLEDMQKLAQPAPSSPSPEPAPWGQPAASDAGSTRAFPPMNFGGDAPKPYEPPAPSPADSSSGSMWDAPEQSASPSDPMPFGGGQSPDASPTPEPSPWDAPHEEFAGETSAFPKMSFDEMNKMAEPAHASESAHDPWTEQPPEAPSWSQPASASPSKPDFQSSSASTPASKSDEDDAFGETSGDAATPASPATSSWMDSKSESETSKAPSSSAAAGGEAGGHLTDEQIDRIARRVVELMADKTVRDIAWEVIPDLAERVVKERIRQLESE